MNKVIQLASTIQLNLLIKTFLPHLVSKILRKCMKTTKDDDYKITDQNWPHL